MVLYAYVDESYIKNDVYLVGALVLTRAQVDAVQFGLEEVLWRTNRSHPEVGLETEFHGQQLFQRKDEWDMLRERPDLSYAIYRRAVGRVARSNGSWFVAGVRRPERIAIRYPNDPWPPHAVGLHYLLQDISDWAGRRGETVRVIADNVENQHLHEAKMKVFQHSGKTIGGAEAPGNLDNIEEGFEWVDSRSHRALQAADLLTYIYLRKRFRTQAHPRAVAEVARLADIARPILTDETIWTP